MGLWEQVYKLTANDAWQADNFGWSVATDGTFAAAGALYDDDGGTNSGSAYVFERKSKKDWPQIAKLVANDHDALDNFGISVGLSRGHAVVGSPQDDDLALSTGSAYLFDLHAPLTCADDPACMGCLTKNIGTGAITCMGLWSPRRCQHSNKLNKRTTYCPDDLSRRRVADCGLATTPRPRTVTASRTPRPRTLTAGRDEDADRNRGRQKRRRSPRCLAASCPSNTCAAKKANGAKKCKAWSQVRCGNMKGQAPRGAGAGFEHGLRRRHARTRVASAPRRDPNAGRVDAAVARNPSRRHRGGAGGGIRTRGVDAAATGGARVALAPRPRRGTLFPRHAWLLWVDTKYCP